MHFILYADNCRTSVMARHDEHVTNGVPLSKEKNDRKKNAQSLQCKLHEFPFAATCNGSW